MEMDEVYFEGDPEVDSTRRQLERLMQGRPKPRRWPWVVAALAGGAAGFAFWRMRSRRPHSDEAAAETEARPVRSAPVATSPDSPARSS